MANDYGYNALDNNFKTVNQTDPYYAQRLQEHTREKEINKNLKDMIMNLSYSKREPNEDTLVMTKKLRELLNTPIQQKQGIAVPKNAKNSENGVPTGGAANIENNIKTSVSENIFQQKGYKKIDEFNEHLDNLNKKLEDINKSNYKISKNQLLNIFEELKTTVSEMEKFYLIIGNTNILSNRFNELLDKLPEVFNNAKRVVNKYRYYNKSQEEDIKIIEKRIEEIEQLLPKEIVLNIDITKKILSDIKYLIMNITDNIRYRLVELEEEPIPEEILKKYPKPQNMSKENEEIFEYNLRHLYDKTQRQELRVFLIDQEGFIPFIYDDWDENKHELHPGDKIKGTKTIGYGFTTINGKPLVWGMRMTEQEADKILEKFIDENQRYIDLLVKVPLTQNQYDALVSIMYNKGYGNFESSDIYKYLEKGDYINTAKAILEDGKKYHIEKRRKAEKDKFISDFPFFDNDY